VKEKNWDGWLPADFTISEKEDEKEQLPISEKNWDGWLPADFTIS